MFRELFLYAPLLLAAGAMAEEASSGKAETERAPTNAGETPAQYAAAANNTAKTEGGAKTLSGMSILGNQEAPKALVIVPWKSSRLGETLGISKTLDDARQPVDKDVFMRELAYYEIRIHSQ